MDKPPVLKPPKSVRLATTLNLILPGAGQFYLGQRWVGAFLAGAFLVCLVAAGVVFLLGYLEYFDIALSGKILEGDKLEHIANLFHPLWLLAFLGLALLIYLVSAVLLFVQARRN